MNKLKMITDLIAKILFPEPSKGLTKSGKPFTDETLTKNMAIFEKVFQKYDANFKELLAESMLDKLEAEVGSNVKGLNDSIANSLFDENLSDDVVESVLNDYLGDLEDEGLDDDYLGDLEDEGLDDDYLGDLEDEGLDDDYLGELEDVGELEGLYDCINCD